MYAGGTFGLLTLTVACDDLGAAAGALWSAFATLRRHVIWTRGVLGCEAHLQVARASHGCYRAWNLHIHAVVQLTPLGLSSADLSAHWTNLLREHDYAGSGHFATIRDDHWAFNDYERTTVSAPAFYVTSQKPGQDLRPLSMNDLEEVIRFLHRKRRVSLSGNCRKARKPRVVSSPGGAQ